MVIKKYYKYFIVGFVMLFTILLVTVVPAFAKENTNNEIKHSVPFSEVKVDDGLMRDYTKLVICEVIPTAITNVERPGGGMDNIKWCAEWHRYDGAPWHAPEGALFVDSDVHKVLESMCMALDTPSDGDKQIEEAQAKIKSKLEEWIPYYQWAPEQFDSKNHYKGYFDSYWSLFRDGDNKEYEKYSNIDNHELYCQGHFIEAAVAHYRYSKNHDNVPDTRLLNVAINSADHIVKTFGLGEGQRKQIPGHQEIELALMKLAKLCYEIGGDYGSKAQAYMDQAAFFLDTRGDHTNRPVDLPEDKWPYYQDHALVENQDEAVGHCVRAQYMYTAMCELASANEAYAARYNSALNKLWEDVEHEKQYVTGGVGEKNHSEGFADKYFLPNYTSYCETCAGIANMMWNRSMSTLYDGAKYADQIETDLYNNVLGCINFEGHKFYYENRLCTSGAFDRNDWYGTACCPPNFTRTILQLGGYIYNTTSNDVYINQFISNTANFAVGDNNLNIKMKSGFPYDTTGYINIAPEKEGTFNVHLRKPSWTNNYTIKINGTVVQPAQIDDYLVISGQTWSVAGTNIEFSFDMPLIYEKSDDRVETNQGLCALRHGPLIYCAEACDNEANFDFHKALLDRDGNYSFGPVEPLDGMPDPYGVCSVSVLNHDGKLINGDGTSPINWRFIPYYARCNRILGAMHTYVHDGLTPIKTHQRATASASFTNPGANDFVGGLNDATNDPDMRWTSWNNDEEHPFINPWVQYDFKSPVKFNGFNIKWYDDGGGVQTPDSWDFVVYNSITNTSEEVNIYNNDKVTITNNGDFQTVKFNEIYEGDLIRLTMYNSKVNRASGIVEWEIIDDKEYDELLKIEVTKQPNKTEYNINEEFDPSGMVVEATYKDKTGKEYTKEINDYTWSPTQFVNAGKQEVTISFSEQGVIKTTTVAVDVLEPVNPQPTDGGNNYETVQTSDNLLNALLPVCILLVILSSALMLRKRSN